MSDAKYNLQFEKLCSILKLGELLGVPEAISGGLLHRMYALETTKGKFAVKALNPQIMLRPTAMQNYINSERIAGIAAKNIPALPAKKFDGSFMQKLDNQFYLVFDWVDGKSLRPDEISAVHCEKIGAVLGNIHMTDFSELDIPKPRHDNPQLIDWNFYLERGYVNNAVWINSLEEIINKLYDWNARANKAASFLSSNMVISHRDLDSKNVMWNDDKPLAIDWESAGFVNPMHELIETALYWSENEMGNIDKERFLAFIEGYKRKWGKLEANWRMVFENGFSGKLEWLEYSLKRSLWIECSDTDEQQLGTAQVVGTINALRGYADRIDDAENWLNNEV